MGEHFADCVDICAIAQEQGGVGVAEAVECDVLCDSGCREPFLELVVDDGRGYVLEYESCAWLSAKFVGFVRDRECCLGLGLFCFDADAVASVWVGGKVFPGELEDVASSESCEAGEERGCFDYWVLAWSLGKFLKFFCCEVFSSCVFGFYFFKVVVDVFR